MKKPLVYLCVFLSGFTSLVYQVLWMKQLGLLFGNTAHAASVTLTAFFGGLAAGSWYWGRRVGKAPNPLRTYAWLESGIAAGALVYFFVLAGYFSLYPAIYQHVDSPGVRQLVKFLLAAVLVLPASFCMGGTIPVIGQYLIRRQSEFGRVSAWLYSINTLGAASGAAMAGFFFPLWFGFRLTCVVAMVLTGLIALLAFRYSRGERQDLLEYRHTDKEERVPKDPGTGRWALACVCFLSGFGFLALEVLWNRMYAQVLENSVYTYASILVIVLLCLAAGAFCSTQLAKSGMSPKVVLLSLLLLSGLAVSLMPQLFMVATDSLKILAIKEEWHVYIGMVFQKGFLTIGPPALLLGMIFPYLMKVEERRSESPGASLGWLAATNTLGAILGSFLAGFVLLERFGMWKTTLILALLYPIAVLLIPTGKGAGRYLKGAAVLLMLLQVFVLNPADLPVNSVDPNRARERILETWEASDCTVAVSEGRMGLTIRINSHYGLGSTGAFMQQKLQSDIPLMIRPETESIFYLGMGTGITAGQSLHHAYAEVNRVVVCELVPEVITASRKYMTDVNGDDYTFGLFSDSRATVLAEDGRHYLMASNEKFDMVNADLFVPFRSGAGSLYTKEHFESVRERLNPGGLFVQWLPMYQVTENEFMIIARTMLEVFDQVSLWRHSFQPGEEVLGLVGHNDKTPLPGSEIDNAEARRMSIRGATYQDSYRLQLPFDPEAILFFYCGNLTKAAALFQEYPVNSDDRPMIEYMAPRTYRQESDVATPWFVGPRIARLVEAVQLECPPETDPLLVNRSKENRRLPVAGSAFYRARIYLMTKNHELSSDSWDAFVREWTNE